MEQKLQTCLAMPIEDAKQMLEIFNYDVRIVDTNQRGLLLTCDYNPNRVNLITEDGIVIEVSKG